MGIKIIEEPDIELTKGEYEALHHEYLGANAFRVTPLSFESWVREKRKQAPITSIMQTASPRMISKSVFGVKVDSR